MIESWKNLSKQVKIIIIVGVLTFISIVVLAFIFPHNRGADNDGSEFFQISTDPVSGEEVSTGQEVPEEQEVPGAPTFLGMSALLDRGMNFDTAREVLNILSHYYAEHQIDGKDVTRFSLSPEITHQRLEDGSTSIYTSNAALNIDIMRTLTITINNRNLKSITIADTNGENAIVIYE